MRFQGLLLGLDLGQIAIQRHESEKNSMAYWVKACECEDDMTIMSDLHLPGAESADGPCTKLSSGIAARDEKLDV
ncbi:hypothetical protein Tco_0636191 [Tanacetum coccineum]